MRYRLCLGSALGLALVSTTLARQATPPVSAPGQAEMFNLGLRGVYFVENQGQWSDARVAYGFKTRGLDIAFRESSFTMHLVREVGGSDAIGSTSRADAPTSRARAEAGFWATSLGEERPLPDGRGSSGESAEYDHLTLTVTFPGSNEVQPQAANAQSAKFNYFIGDDESKWASNVPSFGEVIYPNLYDGVDLHIKGEAACGFAAGGILKYEFHVAPGADWSQIRIAYDGIDSLCIDPAGNLQINTSFGTLADAAPVVWQEDGGTAVPAVRALVDASPQINGRDARSTNSAIPARFELIDGHTYRIVLDGPVDPAREIIIDPDVEWMLYIGGSGQDSADGVAFDSAGDVFISGHTTSEDFEGGPHSVSGETDAHVTKVSSAGEILWATFIGGSARDGGDSIAIHQDDSIFVTGDTGSTDFPRRNNSLHGSEIDVFVARLDSQGQLMWATYAGGAGHDEARGIEVDREGNALVGGYTPSADFEGRLNSHHNSYPGRDGYVLKVGPTGVLQWMLYLGGTAEDVGLGLAVDSSGNAFVSGDTGSVDFDGRVNERHGTADDAFVAKVDPSGTLIWVAYVGGSRYDSAGGVAVDTEGNAYVAGDTYSNDFEGHLNVYHGGGDGYVVKLDPNGAVQFMAYLGGTDWDPAVRVAIGPDGNIFVSGDARSDDFPHRLNSRHGWYDAYLVQVSALGRTDWMLYMGGSVDETAWGGLGVDRAGNVYLCGDTQSRNFANHRNEFHGADYDGFLVKVRSRSALAVSSACPAAGPIEIEWNRATPEGLAALLYARSTGTFTIPNNRPCAGNNLGLGANQLQIVFTGNSDANGARILNANAGPDACGAYLQLLDLSTCSTSNVARIE